MEGLREKRSPKSCLREKTELEGEGDPKESVEDEAEEEMEEKVASEIAASVAGFETRRLRRYVTRAPAAVRQRTRSSSGLREEHAVETEDDLRVRPLLSGAEATKVLRAGISMRRSRGGEMIVWAESGTSLVSKYDDWKQLVLGGEMTGVGRHGGRGRGLLAKAAFEGGVLRRLQNLRGVF